MGVVVVMRWRWGMWMRSGSGEGTLAHNVHDVHDDVHVHAFFFSFFSVNVINLVVRLVLCSSIYTSFSLIHE